VGAKFLIVAVSEPRTQSWGLWDQQFASAPTKNVLWDSGSVHMPLIK
jgi:hypothetical protein